MRISDWSSDVCSSDLPRPLLAHDVDRGLRHPHRAEQVRLHLVAQVPFTQLLSHSEVSIAGVVDHDVQASEVPVRSVDRGDVGSAVGDVEFDGQRSEEHTSELQSLMRISYAVFCLKKKTRQHIKIYTKC